MLNSLLSSLLLDLSGLVKEHADFFDKKHEERKSTLSKMHFSAGLAKYLETVKKNSFLDDMEELIKGQLTSVYRENRIVGVRLAEMLSTYFDREIEFNFEEVVGGVEGKHYILVQSPIKLDPGLKDQIRTHMFEKYPTSSPIFSVNKSLVGGLRIYIDGKTEDLSWASKLNSLDNLLKK